MLMYADMQLLIALSTYIEMSSHNNDSVACRFWRGNALFTDLTMPTMQRKVNHFCEGL